jgi:hypothetical protein
MKRAACITLALLAAVAAHAVAAGTAAVDRPAPAHAAAGTDGTARGDDPSPVKRRIGEILRGPEFAREEVVRLPKFKERPDRAKPAWLDGLEDFVRGLSEILRVLAWALGAIAILAVLAVAHRWWQAQAPSSVVRRAAPVPVTVAGLDIRPDSLPMDIGLTARMAWEQGERAQALSLLYRGAISSLVMRFGARIRESATEGDCVRAARLVLGHPAQEFFERLTSVRSSAVYASRWPESAPVLALCDEYAVHFRAARGGPGSMPTDGEAGR